MTRKTLPRAVIGAFFGLLLGSAWIAAQPSPLLIDIYAGLRDFLNRDCPIGTTESDAQQRIKTLLKTGDAWEPLVISIFFSDQTNQHAYETVLRDNDHRQALEVWWTQYQTFLQTRPVPLDQEDPLKAITQIDKSTFLREWQDSWKRKHQERAAILLSAREAHGSAKATAALNAANIIADKDLQAIILEARTYFSTQHL